MKDEITLADGTTMTWDEFSKLSDTEQSRLMKRTASGGRAAGSHMPQRELLPRIRAAAERNRVTEEDLLTFIKIMHDTFFPPAPSRAIAAKTQPQQPPKQQGGGCAFQPKAVRTPAGDFESIAAATRYYGVDGGRIRSWIKRGKEGFEFI
jgi:hypothetical protein